MVWARQQLSSFGPLSLRSTPPTPKMSAPKPLKVLVTGSANTSLAGYFKKLATLQAKHQFDLCLALDLFSGVQDDSLELAQLLAGQIKSPLQIYCAVGGGVLPPKVLERIGRAEEVAENVLMLGERHSIAV